MRRKGFSIFEVLIALFIGSVAMSQMLEGMRQVMQFFFASGDFTAADRTVTRLFHQIERDCSAAFVPFAEPIPDPKKEGKDAKPEPPKGGGPADDGDKDKEKKE